MLTNFSLIHHWIATIYADDIISERALTLNLHLRHDLIVWKAEIFCSRESFFHCDTFTNKSFDSQMKVRNFIRKAVESYSIDVFGNSVMKFHFQRSIFNPIHNPAKPQWLILLKPYRLINLIPFIIPKAATSNSFPPDEASEPNELVLKFLIFFYFFHMFKFLF